jgi:hypothetical protein
VPLLSTEIKLFVEQVVRRLNKQDIYHQCDCQFVSIIQQDSGSTKFCWFFFSDYPFLVASRERIATEVYTNEGCLERILLGGDWVIDSMVIILKSTKITIRASNSE